MRILWEYKDRGKKGYDLTEKFFTLVRTQLPAFRITGPERAGKDILLGSVWPDYPKPDRPADFIIKHPSASDRDLLNSVSTAYCRSEITTLAAFPGMASPPSMIHEG